MARKITRTPVDPMTGKPLGPSRVRPVSWPPRAAEETAPVDLGDETDPYPPTGNIEQVLEWVDRAPEGELRSGRAKAATAAEAGRAEPRTTLLPQLAERITG